MLRTKQCLLRISHRMFQCKPCSRTSSNIYNRNSSSPVYCLTNDTATVLISGYSSLLTNYTDAVADSLLAADFTDTSDSINELAGYPPGSTTFPAKIAFKYGQGAQPSIGFTVLSIDTVTCTNVAFRWAANVGQGLFPIKGINSFVASNLNNTSQGWQIKSMYSEFNSLGWLINLGGQCSFSSGH